jgi:ER degradation enhancer, mannosidase alpha-like 2
MEELSRKRSRDGSVPAHARPSHRGRCRRTQQLFLSTCYSLAVVWAAASASLVLLSSLSHHATVVVVAAAVVDDGDNPKFHDPMSMFTKTTTGDSATNNVIEKMWQRMQEQLAAVSLRGGPSSSHQPPPPAETTSTTSSSSSTTLLNKLGNPKSPQHRVKHHSQQQQHHFNPSKRQQLLLHAAKLYNMTEVMANYTTTTTDQDDDDPVADDGVVGSNNDPKKKDKSTGLFATLPPFPRAVENRALIKRMFSHAYDHYMQYAFPAPELKPISCTAGTFSLVQIPGLTLIDALDTLLVLHNGTEFARATERLRELSVDDEDDENNHHMNMPSSLFHLNVNVSVFETNIRILGGLLSAHQLAVAYFETNPTPLVSDVWDKTSGAIRWGGYNDDGLSDNDDVVKSTARSSNTTTSATDDDDEKETAATTTQDDDAALRRWEYDGFLLTLAIDLGERLLPAFRTSTGIPYGTINLLYGVPDGETPVASLAGAGTLNLEMELLSRYSGDERFGQAARLASKALFLRRSKQRGLFGKHIDIQSAAWTETLSGIGSNSDSYLEYLGKMYLLFPEHDDFWYMFRQAYRAVHKESRLGEWYADEDMNYAGGSRRTVLESLAAFYPGLQSSFGEHTAASKSLNSFFLVREHVGFLPERFHYQLWTVDGGGRGAGLHPLRPELLESAYHLSRISPSWQWASDLALRHLEQLTKVPCGYATVEQVHQRTTGYIHAKTAPLVDEMPSFYLSETLKYLYLTFDEDNFLHRDKKRQWIFTTEAHPIHSIPQRHGDDGVINQHQHQKNDFVQEIAKVQSLLKTRLGLLKPGAKAKPLAMKEKWSDKTTSAAYLADMAPLRQEQQRDNARAAFSSIRDFLAPFSSHRVDVFGEIDRKTNVAHLTLADLGDLLPQACPNWHHRDLFWVGAVTGGVVDYASSYVTSVVDGDHSTNHVLFGAADALGLVGDDPQEELETCLLTIGTKQNKVSTTEGGVAGGFNVASDLGEFQVATMAEGNGFHVHHVDSGDQIFTTIVEPDDTTYEQLALVSTTSHGKNNGSSPRRRLNIADFHGNTFDCTLEVYANSQPNHPLREMPCSPSLFGPSNVLEMGDRTEYVLESMLTFSEEDAQGCDATRDRYNIFSKGFARDVVQRMDVVHESDVCRPESIRLVRRGECSFIAKAVNAKRGWNADGIVVVNSEDDQHFMMSSSKEENDYYSKISLPFSVLISGRDGDTLFTLLESHENDRLVVRLKMRRKIERVEQSGKVKAASGIEWPVVRGSGNTLDILSEFGWGIRSVQQVDAEQDWQMQLLRHSIVDT